MANSLSPDQRQPELLLDVPVHPIDYAGAIELVKKWIHIKNRPPAFIIQANVYSLVTAQENARFREMICHADLSVPDGMPLVWMLKFKGHTVRDRVYGPDLMLSLCEVASSSNWRVFLYGGRPDVVERLGKSLIRRYPSLNIVGAYSPPFRDPTPEEDVDICSRINKMQPDIVWVGLGSPKQDLWMYDHRSKLDVSVLHGVGAAFDFLSGEVRQAPRWMMRAGLEWLYRLVQEPARLWKRYTITNMKFLYYLLVHAVRKRGGNVDGS